MAIEVRERQLGGEKARRIVEAMRDSVAEVGVSGSTFERVSAKAGVSRGLLHYYFGTKERLLVEVIRRDAELRIEAVDAALADASSVDEVLLCFFRMFERTLSEEQGYVYLMSELFIAGRHREEIRRELGELYARARDHFAEQLRQKEREGVLKLRFEAEAVVTYLFAVNDGGLIQELSDPEYDFSAATGAGLEVARFLLDAR
jgi:AcrR family transcriptional regulator